MTAQHENIIDLMGPREIIGQAIAVLMSRHDVNRDGAFEMLVQGSAEAHYRVRDVAEGIVRGSVDQVVDAASDQGH